MLKSSYDNIILGKNYVSLSFAIMQIRKNADTVLVVDDPEVTLGHHWFLNIGLMEVSMLSLIGTEYDINGLKNIDDYLKAQNTIISLNEKIIELGASPFANIRELARKLPELFTSDFISGLNHIDPSEFDRRCIDYFSEVAQRVYTKEGTLETAFSCKNREVLDELFDNFILMLNSSDDLLTKQLHFVLQILYQTIFSNAKNNVESRYLLSSILSPRFSVDEKRLCETLSFQLKELKGDIKETPIEDWLRYKGDLKSVLLASFEGLIDLKNLYYFGRIKNDAPFENLVEDTLFHGIEIRGKIHHDFLDNYKNKRIIFSRADYIGTDFPHWEIFIDDQGQLFATYCYADFQGTKPSFHYKKAALNIFDSLAVFFPGLDYDEWLSSLTFGKSKDLWREHFSEKSGIKNIATSQDSQVFDKTTQKTVKHLHYWGPLRSRSLGLFSFLESMNR